jgi:hypothetical protein
MAMIYRTPLYEYINDKFTILHDGRFYMCKKYWRVERSHEGHFTLYVQERCKQFVIVMILSVFDIYCVRNRLCFYALDVSTCREYRHMMIYLRFYCNKLKHRPYYEVKDVIIKHFLRLGVYLSPSVFQLIIFFHSLSTTFGDREIKDNDLQTIRQYRERLLAS